MSEEEKDLLTTASQCARDGVWSTTSVGNGDRSQSNVEGVSGAVVCRSAHGHRPHGMGSGVCFGANGLAVCRQCPQHERGFDVATLAGDAVARHSTMQHQPGGSTSVRLQISTE